MFGSDYPYFSYDRLFPDWEAEGFKPQVMEKVFYKNKTDPDAGIRGISLLFSLKQALGERNGKKESYI